MVNITVIISQEEYDAMSVMTSTPEEWAQHAVSNKARKLIDVLVTEHTEKNPNKLSKEDKNTIIGGIDLEKEKNKRRGK